MESHCYWTFYRFLFCISLQTVYIFLTAYPQVKREHFLSRQECTNSFKQQNLQLHYTIHRRYY